MSSKGFRGLAALFLAIAMFLTALPVTGMEVKAAEAATESAAATDTQTAEETTAAADTAAEETTAAADTAAEETTAAADTAAEETAPAADTTVTAAEPTSATTVKTSTGSAVTVKGEKIVKGFYVNNKSLTGMTKDEAKAWVQKYVTALGKIKIRIKVGKNYEVIRLRDLGLSGNADAFIEKAYNCGRKGTEKQKAAAITKAKENPTYYTMKFSFDSDAKVAKVKEIADKYYKSPVDATVTFTGSKYVYTKASSGFKVLTKESRLALNALLKTWKADVPLFGSVNKAQSKALKVKFVTQKIAPKVTATQLKEEIAKNSAVLGTYTTYYNGPSGRNQNIANAAKLLDGAVVQPGAIFNLNSRIRPYTYANGYTTAGAYSGGAVIQEMGGGICQISSTLYNACLYAEMTIIERHPHSLTVDYVPLARDAAMNEGTKNFQFKNNTAYPVTIRAKAGGGALTISIIGRETRAANRKVQLRSVASSGLSAKLYKDVLIDGVVKSTTLINSTSYGGYPSH